jgi:hypothetical protein
MKLYTVEALGVNRRFYAGSQTEAAKFRKEMRENHGAKNAEIRTTEVDVPTNKDGLLKFLNELTSVMQLRDELVLR